MGGAALIKLFVSPSVGDDEHLIRRLGWALVRQWDGLPRKVRANLRKQAIFTEDQYNTAQLTQQIDAVINKYKE